MLNIVAKNFVKADKVDEFKSLAKDLISETKKEDGCIDYKLCEDIKNPNILTFIEIWRDMDAIKKHNASTHFTTIVPKLSKLVEKDMEVSIYKNI